MYARTIKNSHSKGVVHFKLLSSSTQIKNEYQTLHRYQERCSSPHTHTSSCVTTHTSHTLTLISFQACIHAVSPHPF